MKIQTTSPASEPDVDTSLQVKEAHAARRDATREARARPETTPEGSVHVHVSEAAAARLAEAEQQRADAGKLERLRAATLSGELAVDSARIAQRMLPADEGDPS